MELSKAEPVLAGSSLAAATEDFRKKYVADVVKRHPTQVSAAKELDLSTRQLRELISKYEISKED